MTTGDSTDVLAPSARYIVRSEEIGTREGGGHIPMSQHKTNTYAEIASASTVEACRLGQLLYPSTKQLFVQAGITTGMKVLDVGSGAGDVALLLAELVGPTGSIVGVEVHATILETARARVQAAGLTNVSFITGDIRDVALDEEFDAVVERNVLIYLPNPQQCCAGAWNICVRAGSSSSRTLTSASASWSLSETPCLL